MNYFSKHVMLLEVLKGGSRRSALCCIVAGTQHLSSHSQVSMCVLLDGLTEDVLAIPSSNLVPTVAPEQWALLTMDTG